MRFTRIKLTPRAYSPIIFLSSQGIDLKKLLQPQPSTSYLKPISANPDNIWF